VTRDEIRLVVFLLGALLVGALVQRYRPRGPVAPAAPEPASHGWAKPPYVLKDTKKKPAASDEPEAR